MQIIGHRGASAHAPENTLAAIQLAWAQGVAGVEIDVHLTKDNRLVAIHDETLDRFANNDSRVDSLTFDELQQIDVGSWKDPKWANQRVPSLASVIQTIPPGKKLLVEVKCGPACVDVFADDLQLAAADSITIIGFDLEIMSACKQQYPQIAVYLVAEQKQENADSEWLPTIQSLIAKAKQYNLDGLDLSNTLGVDEAAVRLIHEAKLDCCIWTVNTIEDGERLRQAGVDFITTDDPTLFVNLSES
jgi:glycerophosphoryl diester phosphodiesterase